MNGRCGDAPGQVRKNTDRKEPRRWSRRKTPVTIVAVCASGIILTEMAGT